MAELLDARPQIVTTLVFGDDLTDTTGFAAVHEWAARAPERVACAVAALSDETPAAVRETSDVWVAATPGVLEALTHLLAACGD